MNIFWMWENKANTISSKYGCSNTVYDNEGID